MRPSILAGHLLCLVFAVIGSAQDDFETLREEAASGQVQEVVDKLRRSAGADENLLGMQVFLESTLGDYAAAISTARRAVELHPDQAAFQREIMRAKWSNGSYAEARNVGRQILVQLPEAFASLRTPIAAEVEMLDDIVRRMQALNGPRRRVRKGFVICLGMCGLLGILVIRWSRPR